MWEQGLPAMQAPRLFRLAELSFIASKLCSHK